MTRLEFVQQMILKHRQAFLDGNLTVAAASSSAGSVTYRDFDAMKKALDELEAEENILTGVTSPGPMVIRPDFRGIMG